MERETAVAREQFEAVETAMMKRQEDISNVEQAGSTSRNCDKISEQMQNAIRDSLSNHATFEAVEDGDDEDVDDDTPQGKLSEDDEPGTVMGTISNMVHCRMERLFQTYMIFAKLTQPGWGDAADHF